MNKSIRNYLIFLFAIIHCVLEGQSTCNVAILNTTTVEVSNNNDAGFGSFRAAIECVNLSNTLQNIHFNIPGFGLHQILLQTELPAITKNGVSVDATTQPGWNMGNIMIDGSALSTGDGISVFSNNVNIEGLFIKNFNGNASSGNGIYSNGNFTTLKNNILSNNFNGVRLDDGNSLIESNWIGLDSDGISPLGNIEKGIYVSGNLGGHQIGGGNGVENLIAYNSIAIEALPSQAVTISQNQIFCNDAGILTPNSLEVPPIITSATFLEISGTGDHAEKIEVFINNAVTCHDKPCQGKIFLGATFVNGTQWSLNSANYLTALTSGDQVVATSTNFASMANITSPFSTCNCVTIDGSTIEVTNENDTGAGSLRNAIHCANENPVIDKIVFNFTSGFPPFEIKVGQTTGLPLPALQDDGIIIDGTENGLLPGQIVLDGINAGPGVDGLEILGANDIEIYGLQIQNFDQFGIHRSNNFGTNLIVGAPAKGNVLVLNGSFGLKASASSGQIKIQGNYIGTNPVFGVFGNEGGGILMEPTFGTSVLIGGENPGEGNWISNNALNGLQMRSPGTILKNQIYGNARGIFVGNTEHAFISQNSIYCNHSAGILLWNGNNNEPAPEILMARTDSIFGTASPNSIIEIFINDDFTCANDPCQGKVYLGTTTADVFGHWNLTNYAIQLFGGELITATATTNNNTSAFSNCVETLICFGLSLAIDPDISSICEGSSVEFFALPTNGQNPYSYSWETPSGVFSSNSITANQAGLYSVTMTDANDCSVSASKELFISETPSVEIITTTQNLCSGDTIFLNNVVTSGIPSYTFEWNGPNGFYASSSIEAFNEGIYSITVTDGNNCTGTNEIEIFEMESPIAIVNPYPATFCSGDTLQINVVGDGGLAPYGLGWETPLGVLGGSTVFANIPGTYTAMVNDANNCSGSFTFEVTEIASPTVQLDIDTSAFCNGDSVLIQTNVSGVATPISYSWQGNNFTGNSNSIYAFSPGLYSVEIFDNNNCSATDTAFINENLNPTVSIVAPDTGFCQGNFLVLQAIGNGGVAPYTFLWDTPNVGLEGDSIQLNLPGIYTVTITDLNGCMNTNTIEIVEFQNPSLSISANANYLCEGDSMTLVGIGNNGNPPYSYSWNTPNGNLFGDSILIEQGGNYFVTVSDVHNCISEDSIFIEMKSLPAVEIEGNDYFCIGFTTNLQIDNNYASILWSTGDSNTVLSIDVAGIYSVEVSDSLGCMGIDSIEVLALNGPPVSIAEDISFCEGMGTDLDAGAGFNNYLWSNGDTTQITTINLIGNYAVTVTDENDCLGSDTISVELDTFLIPIITGETTFCPGDSVTLNVENDFEEYFWSNGMNGQSITITEPGIYSVTVSGAGGCPGIDSIEIFQNESPIFEIQGNLTFCTGGSTALSATPGFAEYLWSNGWTATFTPIHDPGYHAVTVTDFNGCSSSDSVFVNQIDAPVPEIFGDTLLCPNDSLLILTEPGFNTYLWSNGDSSLNTTIFQGGLYSLTVTADGGCVGTNDIFIELGADPNPAILGGNSFCESENMDLFLNVPFANYDWSTGDSTNLITIDSEGIYSVTVTNDDGCKGFTEISIQENPRPESEIIGADQFCPGGFSVLEIQGDSLVSFVWSNGDSISAILAEASGDYAVTVTDVNGCSNTNVINVSEFEAPIVQIFGSNTFCTGGTTVLTASPDFEGYLWSNLSTDSIITVSLSGVYFVTVTDENACQGTNSIEIFESENLNPIISGPTEICVGDTILLDVGNGFDNYLWSNGSSVSTSEITNPGNYSITVSDEFGCTGSNAILVNEGDNLNISIEGDAFFCSGDSTILSVNSMGIETYLWSNNATDFSTSVSQSGNYSITVSDENSCTGTAAINVEEKPIPIVQILGETIFCEGTSNSLEVPPIFNTYFWSNGAMEATTTINTEGTYEITVTDEFNCTGIDSITVEEEGIPQISNFEVNCNNGIATVSFDIESETMITVSGNGTLNANQFSSNSFSYGAPYQFQIYNTCDSLLISGSDDCDCISFSGNMDINPIQICEEETLFAPLLSNEMLDINDTLEFIISTEPGNLDNILARNTTGIFDLQTDVALQVGITYYLNVVVGSKNAFGEVDLDDPCISISNEIPVIVFPKPEPLQWIDGAMEVCSGGEIFLFTEEILGQNVFYYWLLPNGDTLIHETPTLNIPNVNSQNTGDYMVYVSINGCTSDPTDAYSIFVNEMPFLGIELGNDTLICSPEIELMASVSDSLSIEWSSESANHFIEDPFSAITLVSNLEPGNNAFFLTASFPTCETVFLDSILIFYESPIVAMEDQYSFNQNANDFLMNVLANDSLGNNNNLNVAIIDFPESGNLFWVEEDQVFQYEPTLDFSGISTFQYQVCTEVPNCEHSCSEAIVSIEIIELIEPEIKVPEGLTPNNDGRNDALIIDGIEFYNNVEIIILNRWGDIVFEDANYSNSNPWKGDFQKNGKPLPKGAYYYQLTIEESGIESIEKRGAIYLFEK